MSSPSRPWSRLAAGVCVSLMVAVSGVACGADAETSPTTSTTPDAETSTTVEATPEATGTTIEITVTATSVEPQGEQLEVKAGEPITLRITAENAGELHVHSSPEQQIDYPAGSSEHEITLDQPGIVDVEDHGLGKLVVKLEVR